MAVKTTLIIQSTDQNDNPMEKSLTNANPNLTAAQVNTVARALIALTTNTYVDTIRRDEQSINEALAE